MNKCDICQCEIESPLELYRFHLRHNEDLRILLEKAKSSPTLHEMQICPTCKLLLDDILELRVQ